MPGKMLADSTHSRLFESPGQCTRELGDCLGFGMQCAVADNATGAVIHIQHRRECQIDTVRSQLGSQDVSHIECKLARAGGMDIPCRAERPHWRNRRETLAKSLYPPSFMIDSDQERWIAQGMHARREPGKLLGRRIVARKKDNAARQRMNEAAPIVVGKLVSPPI